MKPLAAALAALIAALAACTPVASAAVVGHTEAPQPLDPARIASLPVAQRKAWLDYLERSRRAEANDRAAFAKERQGLTAIPPMPPLSPSARTVPLERDPAWYGSAEARHIADVIVSFQTPSGGWGKNTPMNAQPRQPGQMYSSDNNNRLPSPGDLDQARDPAWHYIGTLDNDASTTEMLFLARVQAALPAAQAGAYRTSFLRGIGYLLAAQFPNGGWPQVWPLEGGYHDAITFNDDAMLHATEVLIAVAEARPETAFVPAPMRAEARAAVLRAEQCILAAQYRVHGQPTLWAQQVDALTLEPVAARNYEPAALSTDESAQMLTWLMSLPHPSPEVRTAVSSGVAYLQAHEILDRAWTGGRQDPAGRHLAVQAGAGPIWPRYLSLATAQPIFGDRDRTLHDDVGEISLERRNGYSWFNTAPAKVIEEFAAWKSRNQN